MLKRPTDAADPHLVSTPSLTDEMTDAELDHVSGGLNPQPIPPGGARSLNPQPIPPGSFRPALLQFGGSIR